MLKKQRRWLPAGVVALFALCYAFCFVYIYARPHSYETASRWIYDHVPRGARIAGVHWDDRLPISLPGTFVDQYRYLELPLYEPDTAAKLASVTATLAGSDYLILPTQRLQGSLLRVPREYPQTAALFRLLFAGQLGFRLEQTIKQRPLLGDSLFDDDRADESFSVYDHPKVSIFKNNERLSPAELKRRIANPPAAGVLPTLDQVMEADAPLEAPRGMRRLPVLIQILVWLAVLELLGLIVAPLLALAMPEAGECGFGIAKVLGLLLLGIAAWLCSCLSLLSLTGLNLWFVCAGFLLIADLLMRSRWGTWSAFLRERRTQFTQVLLLQYAVLFLFLGLRAFQPEIFWGEKPMDLSFLNYFIRLEHAPPHDPWAAGQLMNYYYFGPLLFALLHKMTGVSAGVGYNLALATLAAWIVTCSFSVLRSVLRARFAAVGACLVLLLSNLAVVYLWLIGRKPVDFDLFWAATRIFTPPGFSEYPLWSLLFGDLHAHVIAEPFAIAVLALSVQLLRPGLPLRTSGCISNRALIGLAFGSLMLINSWDFITYGLIIAALVAVRTVLEPDRGWVRAGRALLDFCLIGLFAAAVCIPFLTFSGEGIKAGYGWVQAFEFNNSYQVLGQFGLWIAAILAAALMAFLREPRPRTSAGFDFLAALLIGSPFILALAGQPPTASAIPWGIQALASLILLAGSVFLVRARGVLAYQLAAALCVAAGLLLAGTELIFLNDRMNTIFKFYNQLWILLAIAACAALVPAATALNRRPRLAVLGILAAPVLISLIGTAINVGVMTTFRRVEGPRPTLDGEAYLDAGQASRDEHEGFKWLNAHIRGTPIMLEAQGDGYREFGRVVMHTGLPIVLGWEHHVSQRGTPRIEIARRRADVEMIYNTASSATALELLRRYNVQLIVVGSVERRHYRETGLAKFDGDSQNFKLLFRSGTFSVYAPGYAPLVSMFSR